MSTKQVNWFGETVELAYAANTPWLLGFTNVRIPVGETLIGPGLVVGALVRLAAFFGGVLIWCFSTSGTPTGLTATSTATSWASCCS